MGAHARLRGRASVAAYTVPTDAPESDGTLEWNATTLVVVSLEAGGRQGIGYTYADTATAKLIHERLLPLVQCRDPLDIPAVFHAMAVSVRNLGRPGIASMAISAVDAALWDLKAKLLGASLADLLGTARAAIPVYGSGGFTSYSAERLQAQLAGWADAGFAHVKMKVGRDPDADWSRVKAAREAIGPDCALFVDANGAYTRKQALAFAERFAQSGVGWFEEPVSSEDLEGLRLLRDRVPGGMDVSAGEYGYDRFYFRRMLQAQAVDVPLSSHCAPSLHLAACCAAQRVVHLEYFHDHVRIEQMLFDGFREPKDGAMAPERSRPGLGIELKASDAERYRS